MRAPCGIELKIGQVWEEVDPRHPRQVTIFGFNYVSDRVTIKCASNTSAKLSRFHAKLSRFHGKRGGYRFVREKE